MSFFLIIGLLYGQSLKTHLEFFYEIKIKPKKCVIFTRFISTKAVSKILNKKLILIRNRYVLLNH